MIEFIKKHPDLFCILGLILFCISIFFVGIGSYPLMDVDETRYVLISRDMYKSGDFMTLLLNGKYFFEKPPLYFWGEILSFLSFNEVNEFTARFPVALYSSLAVFMMFLTGKKIVSRKYGLISALILATSLEFLILAKYAILDIVLAVCVQFALCFGFLTFFVEEKNKKYFWWAFYIFTGLSVLAKGIPGVAIPFGTMFFACLLTKKIKDALKPQYFWVGIVLLLLFILPWHIIMLNTYGKLFFDEYIMKHHIARFINSEGINRAQPWFFYILTLLWGFFPWILHSLAIIVSKIKSFKNINYKLDLTSLNNIEKYLLLNFLAFVVTMLFFSSSSTKLITYILPVYFSAANLLAWAFIKYFDENYCEKSMKIAFYILFGLFFTVGIAGLFTPLFLPEKIYAYIVPVKWFSVAIMMFFGSLGLIATLKNKKILMFSLTILFIVVLSAFGTPKYFKLDYSFGQNDLMKYAKYAKENNLSVYALKTGARYSINYYGPKQVTFINTELEELKNSDFSNENSVFIIRNKHLKQTEDKFKYEIIFKGTKYTLLKNLVITDSKAE